MFWKKRKFSDREIVHFTSAISDMLEVQAVMFKPHLLKGECTVNSQALGYIYGFVDCALRSKGLDMKDASVSVPIVFHILRRLFPEREEHYMKHLLDHLNDQDTVLGMMMGGQQYTEFMKPGSKFSPFGLARIILETSSSKM
jgi:hypothetical protein